MTKKIIVNKFGGGIMIPKFIPLIKTRLRAQVAAGYRPVVVVSALKGVTDRLLAWLTRPKTSPGQLIANLLKNHLALLAAAKVSARWRRLLKIELTNILAELENDLTVLNPAKATAQDQDKIAAYGEKLSAAALTGYLNAYHLPAKKILAEDIPIITDNNFKNANIIYPVSARNIKKKLAGIKTIPVIAGFTGQTRTGQITTLGRGGTDTAACFVGAALRAHKIILWKDVPGILTADPKITPTAKHLPFVDYATAEKVGKVIHPKAIQYIKLHHTSAAIIYIVDPKLKTTIGQRL